MESELRVIAKGLSDDLTHLLDKTILMVVSHLEQLNGGLDLRRMYRIIVAEDFAAELAELSKVTASGNPITYTNEEYAVAIAKVMILPDGEDYEIVLLIDARCALALLRSEDVSANTDLSLYVNFDEAFHLLHHELCHVHDDNKEIDAFGNLMLSYSYRGKDIYIRPLAETCWAEYSANVLSSSTANTAWLEDMVHSFGNAIVRTKPYVDREILAYRYHHDLGKLMDVYFSQADFLARSAAYVLGYIDGLDLSLNDIVSEVYECLSGSYFEPTWNAMQNSLRGMRQSYPGGWQNLSVYDDLAMVLEHYYADMGVTLSTTSEGDTYVDVPFTPETTPQ